MAEHADITGAAAARPRKLPVGIQSFEEIRRGGYVYVDKTRYIWNLIERGKTYFLSRPRRFGKSLFASTLEAYFRGQRDLFDGLAIQPLEDARGDDAWAEHPVIHFSLAGGSHDDAASLADILTSTMNDAEAEYGVVPRPAQTLPVRFANLIQALWEKTGRQVAVLVDEYDDPLLNTMGADSDDARDTRRLYRDFFKKVKDQDRYLTFAFFTGVTRFDGVTVFSGLNNLRDISLTNDYAGICGVTQGELEANLTPEVDRMAQDNDMTRDECIAELARMYDGYRFVRRGVSVYNPFSLFSALEDGEFGNYWFESGTPAFLIRELAKINVTAVKLADGVRVRSSRLRGYRAGGDDLLPLLYQAGYLTIADYNRSTGSYTLRFPNEEVETSFSERLVPYVLGSRAANDTERFDQMAAEIASGDVDGFMTRLGAILAGAPYKEAEGLTYEDLWRNEVYVAFRMLGFDVHSEVHFAQGRSDCIMETPRYVYVFEFKVDQSADAALAQIDEKGYATPFEADPRTVIKVGVNFSSQTRTIESWKMA